MYKNLDQIDVDCYINNVYIYETFTNSTCDINVRVVNKVRRV